MFGGPRGSKGRLTSGGTDPPRKPGVWGTTVRVYHQRNFHKGSTAIGCPDSGLDVRTLRVRWADMPAPTELQHLWVAFSVPTSDGATRPIARSKTREGPGKGATEGWGYDRNRTGSDPLEMRREGLVRVRGSGRVRGRSRSSRHRGTNPRPERMEPPGSLPRIPGLAGGCAGAPGSATSPPLPPPAPSPSQFRATRGGGLPHWRIFFPRREPVTPTSAAPASRRRLSTPAGWRTLGHVLQPQVLLPGAGAVLRGSPLLRPLPRARAPLSIPWRRAGLWAKGTLFGRRASGRGSRRAHSDPTRSPAAPLSVAPARTDARSPSSAGPLVPRRTVLGLSPTRAERGPPAQGCVPARSPRRAAMAGRPLVGTRSPLPRRLWLSFRRRLVCDPGRTGGSRGPRQ